MPKKALPKQSLVSAVKQAIASRPKYTRTALASMPQELADELVNILQLFKDGEFGPDYYEPHLIRDLNESGQLRPVVLTKSMLRVIRDYLAEKHSNDESN